MSLEAKIEELIVALNANTEAHQGHNTSGVAGMKSNIAAMEQEMNADAEITEKPVKAAKKKASKKKAAKKTAAMEPEATQPSETAEAQMQAPLDAAKVQAHIRGIASQLTDTSKLFALIQKHGAQQFSDLEPAVYPALIADAEQLVADGA